MYNSHHSLQHKSRIQPHSTPCIPNMQARRICLPSGDGKSTCSRLPAGKCLQAQALVWRARAAPACKLQAKVAQSCEAPHSKQHARRAQLCCANIKLSQVKGHRAHVFCCQLQQLQGCSHCTAAMAPGTAGLTAMRNCCRWHVWLCCGQAARTKFCMCHHSRIFVTDCQIVLVLQALAEALAAAPCEAHLKHMAYMHIPMPACTSMPNPSHRQQVDHQAGCHI